MLRFLAHNKLFSLAIFVNSGNTIEGNIVRHHLLWDHYNGSQPFLSQAFYSLLNHCQSDGDPTYLLYILPINSQRK